MRLLVTRPEPDAARTARGVARARARGAGRAAAVDADDRCGFRRAVRCRADDQRECGARARGASARRRTARGCRASRSARAAPRPRARPASRDVASADGALGDLVATGCGALRRRSRAAPLSRGRGSRRRSRRRACAHGIAVETVVIYRAVAAERLPPELTQALSGARLDGALHYSRRSVTTLLDSPRRPARLTRCSASRITVCRRGGGAAAGARAQSGFRSRRAPTKRLDRASFESRCRPRRAAVWQGGASAVAGGA